MFHFFFNINWQKRLSYAMYDVKDSILQLSVLKEKKLESWNVLDCVN